MQKGTRDAKLAPLTQTDRQLLSILRQDSRRSISEMAAVLGVSRTTVKERMDRLHESGVIEKFTVKLGDLEPRRANGVRTFFAVRMHRPVCPIVYGFISGWPEVVGCWSISGDLDMMILVDCANNDEVERLRDKLARHPEVKTLTTTLVLKQWRLNSDLEGSEAEQAEAS
ncbi:MAG TPA: Lrp/AsnC family transcriptional regulator [Afifellaceae bacterium]|nr:Lrp/AsnC family transcriptional regulator [Afifellaceae bacterium]